MNNSLQIENLSMTFGKRDPVYALNNVNVSFPDCTISGLLGNNGAGKTTLIKCLAGLLTPNQGIIKMSSAPKVLDSNTRRKIISVVLDGGRNLYWYMTVREIIRYFLMLRKQPYDKLKIQQISEYLDLHSIIDTPIQNLSYGMRQRASIAVALASTAKYVIMDEPTNGLDVHFRSELAKMVLQLRDQYECAFILSSHDMAFIESVCEYCVLIDQGKILHSGSIESFGEAFGNNEYIIQYSCNSDDLFTKDCFAPYITSIDPENHRLNISWPCERSLNELVALLNTVNASIEKIDRVSGLTAAINSMTRRREKE